MREGSSDIYRVFQRVLVSQNRIEAALEVAEQGRARAIAQVLSTYFTLDVKRKSDLEPLTIQQIRETAASVNSTLVYYSVIYDANQFSQFYQLSFGKEQPYVHATHLFIWVIQPTGAIAFQQVDLKPLWQQADISLASLVRTTRELMSSKLNSEQESLYLDPLKKLYQILITPIASFLPNQAKESITFIPQDFLFLVPFCALIDDNNQFLIDQNPILIAPSIQVLKCAKAIQKNQQQSSHINQDSWQVLVMGNPAIAVKEIAPDEVNDLLINGLSAEIEANAIATLFKTHPFTGTQATKPAILAQLPMTQIIHLAAQGFLTEVGGFIGAIALAPTNTDQGFLTLRELVRFVETLPNQSLPAQLFVLSRCDPQRGSLWGDGIMAIAHAFLAEVGIPTLMLSLWHRADLPMAEFMPIFYDYFQSNPDKAQALQDAMLTFRQTHPHPRDWASLSLIGLRD